MFPILSTTVVIDNADRRGATGVILISMPTEITVRGSYVAFHPPERATVYATLSCEGSAAAAVYRRVAGDLESVRDSLTPLTDSEGAVASWSAGQLRTWSVRPGRKDGRRVTHHAQVRLNVEFRDFSAMSTWVGDRVADTDGFQVSDIAWDLTPAHRDEVLREVRAGAVQDAVTRAQHFADALGLGAVAPLAIADVGLLPSSGPHAASRALAFGASATPAAAPELDLVPQDIELSASVDGRFTAGR